ncbi:hypothetical protein LZ30DRAFT_689816 [Colletotrichum cereale]|nr:hypothetical protein LZ30DRAFT_689816 [Colletotrichum cereale]
MLDVYKLYDSYWRWERLGIGMKCWVAQYLLHLNTLPGGETDGSVNEYTARRFVLDVVQGTKPRDFSVIEEAPRGTPGVDAACGTGELCWTKCWFLCSRIHIRHGHAMSSRSGMCLTRVPLSGSSTHRLLQRFKGAGDSMDRGAWMRRVQDSVYGSWMERLGYLESLYWAFECVYHLYM